MLSRLLGRDLFFWLVWFLCCVVERLRGGLAHARDSQLSPPSTVSQLDLPRRQTSVPAATGNGLRLRHDTCALGEVGRKDMANDFGLSFGVCTVVVREPGRTRFWVWGG